MSSPLGRKHPLIRILALALALSSAVPAMTSPADARAGGGFSFGSRGARPFSAPSFTRTAPSGAQPMQRSETPRPDLGGSGFGATPFQPRRFGFGSGLAAGLLGAGLFGMLTGNGFFGGLDGLTSFFGLLFQMALLAGLALVALRFLRARSAGPAFAGAPFGAGPRPVSGTAAGSGATGSVPIGPSDFDAFEATLVDVQTAYSREDINALSRLSTAEMVRSFANDLGQNRSRGLHNDLSDPKLLQGDLAEAWQEGRSDYATVAMRFSLRDVMIERNSGRIVGGDPVRPSESTELWTFRRDDRGPWRLSAIQQAD